jgi:UDP-N-acetylmuramoylalanine--D-glutamate ligase
VAVDDDYTQSVASTIHTHNNQQLVRVSAQSQTDGPYVKDGILHDGAQQLDLRGIVTLTGRHNWQNAAAAYATARACGVKPDVIYSAMKSFAGLRHRLQLVDTINGVRFINDSKATNADATSNALAPYDTIYWIAGGKPKEGGISTLTDYFPKITHAFLIGAAEEEFASELVKHKVAFTRCGTLKEAVRAASEKAFTEKKKEAVVLLSPACASFDQWKSFEQRGDAFCDMVAEIASQSGGGKRHAL